MKRKSTIANLSFLKQKKFYKIQGTPQKKITKNIKTVHELSSHKKLLTFYPLKIQIASQLNIEKLIKFVKRIGFFIVHNM